MNALPGIGHNFPPSLAEEIIDKITSAHKSLADRGGALITALSRVPATVDDEATNAKCADFVKQIAGCIKEAESHRVAEKEPFLTAGKRVDGFFRAITDPLEKAAVDVKRRMTIFQRAKDDAERKAREDEARRQREEAERLAREATEKAASMRKESDLDGAIRAEETAAQAAKDAEKARRDAEANAAELSRTRSAAGSVASLRTFWTFRDMDRRTLDLLTIRDHIPVDALEKAVRSYIKAGGRELAGVVIYEDRETVVR